MKDIIGMDTNLTGDVVIDIMDIGHHIIIDIMVLIIVDGGIGTRNFITQKSLD